MGKVLVHLSHLQFANDTLFLFGSGQESSYVNLNRLLLFFEAMSGLKTKGVKSSIIGLNYCPSQAQV